MKNIFLFLTFTSAILFTSCEGDPGPPGPAGGLLYAEVFEVSVNNYQYDPQFNQLYSQLYGFPVTVYESDAVLAYRLSGTDNTISPPADIWTQLPQSVFYKYGTRDFFQYNFNHSFIDLQFTIEGNFPLQNIDVSDATNQIFRVVVVPSEYANTNLSMEDLMQMVQNGNGEFRRIE